VPQQSYLAIICKSETYKILASALPTDDSRLVTISPHSQPVYVLPCEIIRHVYLLFDKPLSADHFYTQSTSPSSSPPPPSSSSSSSPPSLSSSSPPPSPPSPSSFSSSFPSSSPLFLLLLLLLFFFLFLLRFLLLIIIIIKHYNLYKNGYRVSPGGKVRPGRAADHSPPPSAAVMEE